MDMVLLILAVILIFILLVVYVLNTVKTTRNLSEIINSLVTFKPDVVAFSLGKGRDNKFQNVVVDNNGQAIIRQDEYPVTLDGEYLIIKEHGNIIPLPSGDGYKITGIDLADFKCPEGFEGVTCAMIPLCSQGDKGTYKALTYSQFNELGLYTNTFKQTPIEAYALEPTHPRIRVRCINDTGDYELQTCPNNTLLDKNLKCQPYDICDDRINGYKHNFKIKSDSSPLADNEYYICNNNQSVKTECANDTVFSMSVGGCITESICFNKGNSTLPYDETTYIQCASDQGSKVTCPEGVEEIGGTLSCIVNTCVPETYTFSNVQLEYTYGNTICNKNVADTVLCDNSPNSKVYKYKWMESFQYEINNWPKEIMNSQRKCVAPTDDIIIDPTIQLKFSEAMPETHKFDLKTQQYICGDDTKFKWDYVNQVLIPNTAKGLVNSAAPCQNDYVNNPNITFDISPIPTSGIYVMCTENALIDGEHYFWPIKRSGKYISSTIKFISSSQLEIKTQSSNIIPMGFRDPNDDGKPLILNGYADYNPKEMLVYYFIGSGNVETPIMFEPVVEKTEHRNVLSTVKTNQNITFAIDMRTISNTIQLLPEVTITSKTLKFGNQIFNAGYVTMTIEYKDSKQATLQLGSNPNTMTFSPAEYPEFKF